MSCFAIVFSVVLATVFNYVSTQLNSPCPEVFTYTTDQQNRLYGIIKVANRSLLGNNTVTLKVELSLGNTISNYNGDIKLGQKLNIPDFEAGKPLFYKVNFPKWKDFPPKATKISVNGQIICSGPPYDINNVPVLVTINLVHMLRLHAALNFNYKSSIINYSVEEFFGNPFLTTSATPLIQEIPLKSSDSDVTDDLSDICGKYMFTNQSLANGSSVIRHHYPWLAALLTTKDKNLEFICSGTLISSKHVLTDAHCLKSFKNNNKINVQELLVGLGKCNTKEWTNGEDSITVGVKDVIIHKNYQALSGDADIAVLTLAKVIGFNSFIRPICLWSVDSEINNIIGQSGIVASWNIDVNGNILVSEPKHVTLSIVSQEECLKSHDNFAKISSHRTFCAGNPYGSGACHIGGGFVMEVNNKLILRGVVSSSIPDQARSCDSKQYLLFTDVSKILDWILNITNE